MISEELTEIEKAFITSSFFTEKYFVNHIYDIAKFFNRTPSNLICFIDNFLGDEMLPEWLKKENRSDEVGLLFETLKLDKDWHPELKACVEEKHNKNIKYHGDKKLIIKQTEVEKYD